MKYSIIYSLDVPRDTSVKHYLPPQRHLWQQTEGDEQYDYDYLEGIWSKGKHRKLVAILNQEQFDNFINTCYLSAEDIETMGSLGAPGFDYGWAPAISFNGDFEGNAILNAYVTPIPDDVPEDKLPLGDEDWQRIRQEIIEKYR